MSDPNSESTPAPEFATLAAVVDHYLSVYQIPGAAVGVLADGQMTTIGQGVISLATYAPTRPDTLFQIGSNSKVFTTTLVMTLVDEGKLDLDTPIRHYLPDLKLADPGAADVITLRQLLSHTSGLEGDRFEQTGVGEDALSKYIAGADDWAQETAPGRFWSYCNAGFGLAGRIVELITGQPFETAMQERVLTPLGLTRSFYFAEDAIVYSAAAGHNQGPGAAAPTVALPYLVGRRGNPAGGIIATTRDMLTFLQFHLGDGTANGEPVLSAASVAAMQTPQATITPGHDWGLGWSLSPWGDLAAISHGGGTNGHISHSIAIPSRGFALVTLTNSSRGGKLISKVEEWAFAHYLGATKEERPHVTWTPDQLDRWPGTYARKLVRSEIRREGDELLVDVTVNYPGAGPQSYPPAPLAALGEWEAVVTAGELAGSELTFLPGADGRPEYVRFGGRLTAREGAA